MKASRLLLSRVISLCLANHHSLRHKDVTICAPNAAIKSTLLLPSVNMILTATLLIPLTACYVALASLNHLPPEIVVHYAAHLVEGQHGW